MKIDTTMENMKTPIRKIAIKYIQDFIPDPDYPDDEISDDDAYVCINECHGQDHLDDDNLIEFRNIENSEEITCQPIENILKELKQTFDYTTEELDVIRTTIIKELFTNN